MRRTGSDFPLPKDVFETDSVMSEKYHRIGDELLRISTLIVTGYVYLVFDYMKDPQWLAVNLGSMPYSSFWVGSIACAAGCATASLVHRFCSVRGLDSRAYYLRIQSKIAWHIREGFIRDSDADERDMAEEKALYGRYYLIATYSMLVAAVTLAFAIAFAGFGLLLLLYL